MMAERHLLQQGQHTPCVVIHMAHDNANILSEICTHFLLT